MFTNQSAFEQHIECVKGVIIDKVASLVKFEPFCTCQPLRNGREVVSNVK